MPPHIKTLDREIDDRLGDDRVSDIEYRFRVVYTFENATKSKSHIKFVHPTDEGAEEARNALIKKEIADKAYPYKAGRATEQIANKSGRRFTTHNHTQAWRKFDVRPRQDVAEPQNTNQDYCIYHEAHGDYTFSEKWIEFIVTFIANDENYDQLKAFRLN